MQTINNNNNTRPKDELKKKKAEFVWSLLSPGRTPLHAWIYIVDGYNGTQSRYSIHIDSNFYPHLYTKLREPYVHRSESNHTIFFLWTYNAFASNGLVSTQSVCYKRSNDINVYLSCCKNFRWFFPIFKHFTLFRTVSDEHDGFRQFCFD